MSAYADAVVPLTRPHSPYPLRPVRPDGAVTPPLILIEGETKSGRSWMCAEFTGHPKINQAWWIEWGEKSSAHEYAAIPGARYEILPHDGTLWSVLSLVEQVTLLARELVSRDGAPLLVIDGMHAEWRWLCDLAHARTLSAPSVARRIEADPAARAERHKIPNNTWTDINSLHDQLMHLLKNFPGIVLVTSRGRSVPVYDEVTDEPIPGETVYRVDGQKDLPFACSAWVRTSRTGAPMLIGARSVRSPLRPGIDDPREFTSLSDLVFGVLGYEPRPWEPDLHHEEVRQFAAGEPRPAFHDWDAKLAEADRHDDPNARKAALDDLWKAAMFQRRRFGTVTDEVIARIEQAGHAAAEAVQLARAQGEPETPVEAAQAGEGD